MMVLYPMMNSEWYEKLDAFYITQNEITNADFVRFLNEEELTPQQVIQILGFKGNNIRQSDHLHRETISPGWVGKVSCCSSDV